ncbi:MAG TPA: hypothetical protein VH062_06725 [Polyangiaceae bacterium]|jgi:hypothetical protein|nr:hypothetical protein [Polyangiaceae bacterium]
MVGFTRTGFVANVVLLATGCTARDSSSGLFDGGAHFDGSAMPTSMDAAVVGSAMPVAPGPPPISAGTHFRDAGPQTTCMRRPLPVVGDAGECRYDLQQGLGNGPPDPGYLDLRVTSAGSITHIVYASSCVTDVDGWYFEIKSPGYIEVVLCPATCSKSPSLVDVHAECSE